jgi:hypothetical protein
MQQPIPVACKLASGLAADPQHFLDKKGKTTLGSDLSGVVVKITRRKLKDSREVGWV